VAELNKDKAVLENGRKAPLKDADAPLRDQLVAKLLKKLRDMDIGHKVDTLWNKGNANRVEWMERQKAYLHSWDSHLIGDTDGPFDGSSQLHIPMPFTVIKTAHARYNQALWMDPPLNAKARNEASIERVPVVQDTMRYYLMDGANYGKGVEKVVDQWIWEWLAAGSAILKWRWDRKYTRYMDVANVTKPGVPRVVTDDSGKEQLVPTTVQEEQLVEVERKTFDGPCLKLVNIEDIVIVGGEGDPDDAEAVLEQDFLTASDLWSLSDQKVFDAAAVEEIIEAGPDRIEGSTNSDIKTQRAQNAGAAQVDATDHERYRIIEAYLTMDIDGSGINADVIVWVHPRTKAVLKATYLRLVSKSGERPYAKADYQLRKGQEFGTGLAELLYPLSKEMDAIHNMRLDFGMLSVMPFGFYRPSSGIDPTTIKLEPGALIPVDNPATDIVFPNLGNRTVFGMQEEAAIQQMVERLTSISDLNLGMMGGQGATRTATGANALMSEMSSNLDIYLRRLNRGWKKALRYLLHSLQSRIPAGTSFRLTGDDGKDYWRFIQTAKDLEGDFDIEVSPNSASSNPQIQQAQADQVLQLVSNPLAIQMGAVGPGQFYEAMKNALVARGVRDWGRYLMKPQGYERTLTPEEEANRLLRGMDVPVTPNQDHQGFIAFVEYVKQHDDLLGQFSEDQAIQLEAQSRKHAQMAQALAQAQAQAANVAQMQRNASMAAPGSAPISGGEIPVGVQVPQP
jgi:hypothetical protein